MKQKLHLWFGIAAALALSIIFLSIFISYVQPMDDEVYDLSPTINLNEADSLDTTLTLGWRVYTQENDQVTLLEHDGLGAFDGLGRLGQTFYYSRVMQETLDAPTIQLGTANRNFSVFLDGVLIYTDCPEQDNRIGYLSLPMREFDRKEDVTVSLPEDYVGKTLTIAQSTPPYAETPRMATRVYPASVKLYCSYAYESKLIAESFQTAFSGTVGYVLGVIILAIFLRRLFLGQFDWGLLFLALTVFLSMSSQLYATTYYIRYFGIPSFLSSSVRYALLAVATMMAFLSSRVHRARWLPWTLTGIYCLCIALFLAFGQHYATSNGLIGIALWNIYDAVGGIVIVLLLPFAWVLWRKDHAFFRYFTPLVTLLLALRLLIQLILPSRGEFFRSLLISLRTLTLQNIAYQIVLIMLGVSLLLTILQAIRSEINRHTEKHLMLEMSKMSQQRYENLRRHNEEVMTLRHDMNRHLTLLRQMTTEEKAVQYLDDLIGMQQRIHPVVHSGNEMIDIILSSRISLAADAGLQVEVARANAPETLPMSDADLCSLTMNLIDNAIEAARKSGSSQARLKLDLHVKNNFFVFICENSADMTSAPVKTKETVPKHGLGLKIVRQIAERYDALLQAEFSSDMYKVSLALPLSQHSK